MTMPRRLIFVRHGQSEGNILEDNADLAQRLKEVPNSEYRLTALGVSQAEQTGVWLQNYFQTLREAMNQDENLEEALAAELEWFGYCSSFVRAIETMGHLHLGLRWKPNAGLIERNWAQYQEVSAEERKRFKERKRRDPLYAKMFSSQAIGELRESTYTFFTMLHREHGEHNVIAVCHGERMLMVRYLLERMTEEQFRELVRSRHIGDKIQNTQVLEYTRQNPETGELSGKLDWMRSFCPWALREKDLRWKKIVRATFSDAEALEYAARHERYL